MADVINANTTVAVEKEVTEGTLVLPSGAASFVSPLEDGVNEITIQTKEVLERGNTNTSLDKDVSRSGIRIPNGTIGFELKSGDAEAAPEYSEFIESALGGTEAASADVATTTSHTTDTINMADTSAFAVNEIVAVKEAGGEIIHVSPVESIVTNTSITLLVAYGSSFADTVTVKKLIDYRTADSGHPSLSITKYNTNSDATSAATRETAAGCKINSMSIENWTTGQQPTITFAYEGMEYTNTVAVSSYTGTYDDALPVVALNACIYKDGVSLPMNDFTVSVENTIDPKTTTCSENGRVGLRVSNRSISGTVNPYKADDSVAEWDDWDDDTTFSLFAWGYNATTSGNKEEVVSLFMPNCQYTEVTQASLGGLAQNAFTYMARKDSDGPTLSIAFG